MRCIKVIIALLLLAAGVFFSLKMGKGINQEPSSGVVAKCVVKGSESKTQPDLPAVVIPVSEEIQKQKSVLPKSDRSVTRQPTRGSEPKYTAHRVTTDRMLHFYEKLAIAPPGAINQHSRFNADKDRLMKAIEKKAVLDPGTIELFVALLNNRELDEVTRDYALQHLGAVLVRLQANPACGRQLNDADENAGALEAMWRAAGDVEGAIAGTALLAVNRLSEYDPNVDRGRIRHEALRMLNNEQASPLSRATALQFCETNDLALIRDIASSSEHYTERSAAIRLLGKLGNEAEVSLLKAIEQSNHPQFMRLAKDALLQISLAEKGVNHNG